MANPQAVLSKEILLKNTLPPVLSTLYLLREVGGSRVAGRATAVTSSWHASSCSLSPGLCHLAGLAVTLSFPSVTSSETQMEPILRVPPGSWLLSDNMECHHETSWDAQCQLAGPQRVVMPLSWQMGVSRAHLRTPSHPHHSCPGTANGLGVCKAIR